MNTVLTMLTPQDHRLLQFLMRQERDFVVEEGKNLNVIKERLDAGELPIILFDEAKGWKKTLLLCKDKFVPKVIICSRRKGQFLNELWAEVFNLGAFDLVSLPFEEATVRSVIKLASLPISKAAP